MFAPYFNPARRPVSFKTKKRECSATGRKARRTTSRSRLALTRQPPRPPARPFVVGSRAAGSTGREISRPLPVALQVRGFGLQVQVSTCSSLISAAACTECPVTGTRQLTYRVIPRPRRLPTRMLAPHRQAAATQIASFRLRHWQWHSGSGSRWPKLGASSASGSAVPPAVPL